MKNDSEWVGYIYREGVAFLSGFVFDVGALRENKSLLIAFPRRLINCITLISMRVVR